MQRHAAHFDLICHSGAEHNQLDSLFIVPTNAGLISPAGLNYCRPVRGLSTGQDLLLIIIPYRM